MDTRGVQKKKNPRGRPKKRDCPADKMDESKIVSRNVADGNETGDHNMNIGPMENEMRSIEVACDAADMLLAANSAVPKNENDNEDFFSEYFHSNGNDASDYHAIDDTATDRIMEEADMLLEEFRNTNQTRSEIMNNILEPANAPASTSMGTPIEILDNTLSGEGSAQSNDSNSVTLVEMADAVATTSRNAVDDSVVIIHDEASNQVPPTATTAATTIDDDDDEVIFVEGYTARPQRITAVVDLCSPESSSSNRRKRQYSPSPSKRPNLDLSESMDDATPVQGVKCPVCMEKIKNGPPHSTICGHIFCGDCIKRAISARKKCPICNKNLTLKNIHPLYFT